MNLDLAGLLFSGGGFREVVQATLKYEKLGIVHVNELWLPRTIESGQKWNGSTHNPWYLKGLRSIKSKALG
jgi:hypothetical protein